MVTWCSYHTSTREIFHTKVISFVALILLLNATVVVLCFVYRLFDLISCCTVIDCISFDDHIKLDTMDFSDVIGPASRVEEKSTHNADSKNTDSVIRDSSSDSEKQVISSEPALQRKLKSRHLQMIAIGPSCSSNHLSNFN